MKNRFLNHRLRPVCSHDSPLGEAEILLAGIGYGDETSPVTGEVVRSAQATERRSLRNLSAERARHKEMTMKVRILLLVILTLVSVNAVSGQTTPFTYQGKLTDGANPANGNYDMQFKLFDTASVGTGVPQGPTITNSSVPVSAGIFTVQLDFGAGAFSGPPRFLEIGVRPAASPDPYTLLAPRQAVTSTPYSVRSLSSAVADVLSSACVGCVSSTQVGSVSGSAVSGTIPVASVPSGSGNYVQNTTSPQIASDFNISGNGTAGGTLSASTVTATSQFNIGVNRVLALGSSAGIFVGRLAGVSNTTGSGNSFFGDSAGRFNTTASNNSFFGREAGTVNTANDNSFFGTFSGKNNTSGDGNSFFGSQAGTLNVTGTQNSFFGTGAGASNLTGSSVSFFGFEAGLNNTIGGNSFFGAAAGRANTSGLANSFFGLSAGSANTDSDYNSFFGYYAGAASKGTQNSFFGAAAGSSNTTGLANSFFGYEAGTDNTTGVANTFLGDHAGHNVTTGSRNVMIGSYAGHLNHTGSDNVFVGGSFTGTVENGGDNLTLIGSNAKIPAGFTLQFAAAVGAGSVATQSNSIYLGRPNGADAVRIPGSAVIDGTLVVGSLGSAGSTSICLNAADRISPCSSSLRYKTSVQSFKSGLEVVRRLRPITFDWKEGGVADVGFGAEEVNAIEPLLTTRNAKGEIEGVKYGQLTTVLVNAVKEQQLTIERQQQQISTQGRQLEILKKLVCLSNPQAEVCK